MSTRIFNGFSHLFLVVWALMVVYPLLWVVMSAFKGDSEVIREPLSLIPSKLHWDNFARAWTNGHLGSFFLNTVLVLLGSVTLTMLLGSMAAYALARYEFPGNRLIYYLFLSGLTLPVYLAAVPLFKGVYKMGVTFPLLGPNKHVMLIVVYVAWSLAFTVFFMHSFFRTLPDSIAEAAMVDGASHTRTFFSVMLPMAKPGLISIGIFNVLGQWNQWYLPTLLMQSLSGEPKHQVISQGLIELSVNQGYKSDWSGLFAGVTMATLPVLIVYIVFQRQVQSGLTAGVGK
ncbi:carbohydrate ABC transporter permease [Micromonospora sp. NPDC006766]|uniref:carbohydrate ABC transporter permease n=1 Tax=Micromonospora sp. NPDC006766 TaxID=3154778 RepID=UPI0033DD7854